MRAYHRRMPTGAHAHLPLLHHGAACGFHHVDNIGSLANVSEAERFSDHGANRQRQRSLRGWLTAAPVLPSARAA